jgi:putative ATP-dependent endonuclease of the OLD family
MYISKISLTNYRGVKEERTIQLDEFSSIVGKNDAGKTIILFAIATFLDIKNFPITYSDFNDIDQPIIFEFDFKSDNLEELLMSKLKSKVKKGEGLEEYVQDFIFNGTIKYRKEAAKVDKKFSEELVLIEDFEQEDIRGLYFMSDDELNAILEAYGISVPVEGKGRNSKAEKVKYIKNHFSEANRITFWIQDESKIASLFPEVEMFKADYGLEADTKFKSNSVSEIQDYFNRQETEEGTELKKVEAEINAEMQKEADAVRDYMKEYASSLNSVQIKPTVIWKDAIKGVDVSFQFDGDDKFIPMSHKGTGYRRLFMVARFRYLAEKSKGNNVIYLIEEPETFLHPTAQSDLLAALKDLSNDNQVIITTHSPVFAGATSVNGVVLCSKAGQSEYLNVVTGQETDFLFKVIDELGIKPSYNLRDNFEKILFVEGPDDSVFYSLICDRLLTRRLEEKVLVLPTGGSSVDSFINITYFKNNGRQLFLILDSDKGLSSINPEKPVIQKDTIDHFNEHFGKAYLLRKSNIENYLHPRAIERRYPHIESGSIHFFNDDERTNDFFKINGISKKHNTQILNSMTKEEFEEVIEEELIHFLTEITD